MQRFVASTLALLLAIALVSKAAVAQEATAAARPNIILILVDDMGFSDLGCYGSEIPTPHIDSLAAGGIRFSQFYNTGRCCPTRASLLTGLYSHQAGIGHMTDNQGVPSYQGYLNDRCITLGNLLQSAGYFTAHTGKWHVGSGNLARLPLQRGFDRFYGVPEGGGFYMQPRRGRNVYEGNEVIYSADKLPPADWYSTDAWTDYGLRYIDEAIAAKKPYFLYLAHNAPHFPLQASPADIARFRGKYRAGWDALRQSRHAKQKEMIPALSKTELTARDATIDAWDALDEKQKEELDLRYALYAAVMARLDDSVGRLIAGLKERKTFDNTLILYCSDNGASDEGGLYGKFGTGEPGTADSDVFIGRAWAGLSNTPFRYYKKNSHEGGISTPLIAHWPAGIQARGEWRRQVGHVIDFMPTLAEVAGATYPTQQNERMIQPMEGQSFAHTFAKEEAHPRTLFWEHEGHAAIRTPEWKLVRAGAQGKWELYRAADSRTEINDVASEHPEVVKQLTTEWQAWAKRVGAKPFAGTPMELPGKKKGKGKAKAKSVAE